MYKTRATQLIQNERVFYVAVISAGDLINLTAVDVWSDDNPNGGYQRAPELPRIKKIAEYAAGADAIMPMGGLLNARGSAYGKVLQFQSDQPGKPAPVSGMLTIPDSALPLYVVDMQHRIAGYRWAIEENHQEELRGFPLVVTIADGLSKMEEVDQFELINTTQKKVRTDLARRLRAQHLGDPQSAEKLGSANQLWDARGALVTQFLNTAEGIWQGRVLPPNKNRSEQPEFIMRETSFVTSLKPVLRMPYCTMISEEQVAQLILNYWTGIARAFPEAFEKPDEHVIQKSNGIFPLHMIAPEVFQTIKSKGGLLETPMFENIFKPMAKELEGSYFWHRDNPYGAARFGAMKGFSFLAAELRNYLPK